MNASQKRKPARCWNIFELYNCGTIQENMVQIGIVGLSVHSEAFTAIINSENNDSEFKRSKVVALYEGPVNKDVAFSPQQIMRFKSTISQAGVQMVDSMEALLDKSDAVMVLSNDGRPHLKESLPALEARKPVFIDKPLAENFMSVKAIFDISDSLRVPVFTSSALRFSDINRSILDGGAGSVLGAETYGPAPLQDAHVDLFWDGIHGVELLFTVMGSGCETVTRIDKENEDVVLGSWKDGRVGVFRGLRMGEKGFGGKVFGSKGIPLLGFNGYVPLVKEIVQFFHTGVSPVSNKETIELYAFMEAADRSRSLNGKPVALKSIMN